MIYPLCDHLSHLNSRYLSYLYVFSIPQEHTCANQTPNLFPKVLFIFFFLTQINANKNL